MSDLLPRNRREFGALVLGAVLSLGASSIPGLTVEPQELTDCRIALASDHASLGACHLDVEDTRGRLDRCWDRRRNVGDGEPP